MPSKARALLREATKIFGYKGCLLVFKNPEEEMGDNAEPADRTPHSALRAPLKGRAPLCERVRHANAWSRGELL
jgi:hypothetical protein